MTTQKVVEIDLGYTPRKFQALLHKSLKRFNVLVCHRRFGKTYFTIREMIGKGLGCEHRNPRYAYIAPTYKQAKSIAWDYLKDFTKGIPSLKVNESELRVDVPRAHPYNDTVRFILLGADNVDALRGLYLDGVVIDEYAQCDPSLWGEVLRPMLADRLGWAIFIGTPKGQNHFHERYIKAKRDESGGWYAMLLKASVTGVISEEELLAAKADMSESEYAQEMECDFTAALTGAYYGKHVKEAETEGRIVDFPILPDVPVQTFWDLGLDDATCVLFVQQIGKEKRIIDYIEVNGQSLPEVIKTVTEKPYIYNRHVFPWDIEHRELTTGRSRLDTIRPLLRNIEVGSKMPIEDRIHAARMIFPQCWFHETKVSYLLECLRNYARKFDSKRNIYSEKPDHNWASHGADTFGYMALFLRPDNDFEREDLQRSTELEYDYWY